MKTGAETSAETSAESPAAQSASGRGSLRHRDNRDRQVHTGSRIVLAGFRAYLCRFERLTAKARQHFIAQDAEGMKADYIERLDLYGRVVGRMAAALERWQGDGPGIDTLWRANKIRYAREIGDRPDRELAETFWNSITRRRFTILGVDPALEFIDTVLPTAPEHLPSEQAAHRRQ